MKSQVLFALSSTYKTYLLLIYLRSYRPDKLQKVFRYGVLVSAHISLPWPSVY